VLNIGGKSPMTNMRLKHEPASREGVRGEVGVII
jgi:hypothetical protein